MAITLNNVKRLNCIRIISKLDDAVDHENSNWDLYDEDPINNESALAFLPNKQPTIFICNFEVDAKTNAKIQDSMIAGVDEDKNPRPAYGGWALSVVKYTLKGIENPPNVADPIRFKVDAKGYAADDVLNILQKFGIIQEIFSHYLKLTNTGVNANAKKS